MFGRGAGRFGHFRERFLERGDLKFVILELLKEKPRHGYEIIRALEERFRGMYAPSPGAVYPTLQMLDDMGYATVQEQDGKRVYTLTDEGRRFLDAQGSVVDEIRTRITEHWGADPRDELRTVMHEMKDIGRLFRRQWRAPGVDGDQLARIREVVSRAYRDIEAILSENRPGQASESAAGSTPPSEAPTGGTPPTGDTPNSPTPSDGSASAAPSSQTRPNPAEHTAPTVPSSGAPITQL